MYVLFFVFLLLTVFAAISLPYSLHNAALSESSAHFGNALASIPGTSLKAFL